MRLVGELAPLLEVHLSVRYKQERPVLDGVQLAVQPGEILGLAGQSGAGKSTLALAILGLLPGTAQVKGHVLFRGRNLLAYTEKELRAVRGKEIGLVLQSPLAALNPALRIGEQLWHAWRAHAPADRQSWRARLQQLFQAVDLPTTEEFLRRYPRELSVGMAQRVLIALATLHQPALLIADEPTSALDALTQAEVLDLFARLNGEFQISMLYISHDLLSMARICHRIAVLYEGRIVECERVDHIFDRPSHPYTRQLISALVPVLPVRTNHP